ncbi:hypothetical protein BX666DRAFT_2032695 [Dichotomocladium elegans]|nr:hypothetical protein BX666DRAFT_2032695 [Dichotomocladium elegans]
MLSLRFFNISSSSNHGSSAKSECTCECYNSPPSKQSKWLRIRRRSSVQQPIEDYLVFDEEVQELSRTYDFAIDELAYAIESQGSIYYDGDRETAQEAYDSCVERYRYLMERLSKADCVKLDALYREPLASLQTQLNALPLLC